jgi:hypothetical protein
LFVEGKEEFSTEMASDFVDEMQDQWPEVEDVTVDRVIRLKQGMIQSGIHLEYHLLRDFVAVYRLVHHSVVSTMPIDGEGDDDSSSTSQLVKEVVRTVQRVTPLKESTPVITSLSEEVVSLATLRNKLVEVSFSPNNHCHRRELIFIATLPLRFAGEQHIRTKPSTPMWRRRD